MKSKALITILILSIIISSCTPKVYFTSEIRERVEGANISLKDLQYYNDVKLTLKRELESGKTQVESGEVKLENGKYIHYIILKPKTPGVCKHIYSNQLSIAFEQGPNKILDFGKPKGGYDFSPYQIYANEWNNNVGMIMYEGKEYYIQPNGSHAKLMIKKSALNKIDIEKRKMKGVRLE
ncbi:MAG: hypothetical protein V2I54_07870 [Bacteroidales bacterium]|jgi:hypothetical protein|nr:hypothetical protein [Bacteroidales bacterium]